MEFKIPLEYKIITKRKIEAYCLCQLRWFFFHIVLDSSLYLLPDCGQKSFKTFPLFLVGRDHECWIEKRSLPICLIVFSLGKFKFWLYFCNVYCLDQAILPGSKIWTSHIIIQDDSSWGSFFNFYSFLAIWPQIDR